jgi:hypothetical protein
VFDKKCFSPAYCGYAVGGCLFTEQQDARGRQILPLHGAPCAEVHDLCSANPGTKTFQHAYHNST